MFPEIDQRRFSQLHATGARVVDVREPDEYRAGHVPGAQLMPLHVLGARAPELPTNAPVYVICQSGARSAEATQLLRNAGVDAINVQGGTAAWAQAGKPIEHGIGAETTR